MRKKDEANEKKQRQKLLSAAWKLFRQKGYRNTTMEDILTEAGCSKGRFYYYFHAKGELLDSLYELFDAEYEAAYASFSEGMSVHEKFRCLHAAMFTFMEEQVGPELLTSLYLSQLENKTGIEFWSRNRSYLRIVTELVREGQAAGELRTDIDAETIADDLMVIERGQLIDWCLRRASYSLKETGPRNITRQISGYRSRP